MNTASVIAPVIAPTVIDAPVMKPYVHPIIDWIIDGDSTATATAPVTIDIARIRHDAEIIEEAEMTTRLFVNDYFLTHPGGDILKHIITEACNSSLWLAARRGTKAAKDAAFPQFAGPGIAPRGLTNTLRDAALLASRASSAELAEKYSEILRIARFAMACAKMVSSDKKTVDTVEQVLSAEEKAAEERKAKRAANDQAEKEALIAVENLAAMKAKVMEFMTFVNDVSDMDKDGKPLTKLTKAQIIEGLLSIACK